MLTYLFSKWMGEKKKEKKARDCGAFLRLLLDHVPSLFSFFGRIWKEFLVNCTVKLVFCWSVFPGSRQLGLVWIPFVFLDFNFVPLSLLWLLSVIPSLRRKICECFSTRREHNKLNQNCYGECFLVFLFILGTQEISVRSVLIPPYFHILSLAFWQILKKGIIAVLLSMLCWRHPTVLAECEICFILSEICFFFFFVTSRRSIPALYCILWLMLSFLLGKCSWCAFKVLCQGAFWETSDCWMFMSGFLLKFYC